MKPHWTDFNEGKQTASLPGCWVWFLLTPLFYQGRKKQIFPEVFFFFTSQRPELDHEAIFKSRESGKRIPWFFSLCKGKREMVRWIRNGYWARTMVWLPELKTWEVSYKNLTYIFSQKMRVSGNAEHACKEMLSQSSTAAAPLGGRHQKDFCTGLLVSPFFLCLDSGLCHSLLNFPCFFFFFF